MRLMIDISEVEFNACKRVVEAGVADWQDKVIASGTPLPTGEWIDRNGNTTYPFWLRYECSICHGYSDMANYCYHCGARMKGEEE